MSATSTEPSRTGLSAVIDQIQNRAGSQLADSALRVLHLDHSTAKGGAEYALLRILNADAPWRAVLLVPGTDRHSGVWRDLRQTARTRLVRLGSEQRAGASRSRGARGHLVFAKQILSQALAVRRSGHFAGADIVHANTTRAALYATIAMIGTRKKLVVHLRDITDVEGLGRLGFITMSRLVLPRASGVIGNSEATLRSAEPYLRKNASRVVIPSASGLVKDASMTPVRQDLEQIGMLARIDPWKGQELLIRAFSTTFRGEDIQLSFAGSPEFDQEDYLGYLRSLIVELGIESQVRFLGHVSDVDDYLRGLDVCVQASLRPEPLGQNVLQYLAAGRPSLAANEGGPTEWINHGVNGLLFEARDEASLAEALESLRSMAIRSKLAHAAANTVGLLSDHEIARAHGSMFQAVARRRRA